MSRLLIVPLLAAFAAGLPAAHAAPDADKINAAIKKGVEFLKANPSDGSHRVGSAALAGLALLENDVPKTDPVVTAITGTVREGALGANQTYTVALSIIYLDKLNEPRDVPLIQVLGARLVVGQNAFGGWGYPTFPDVPAADQVALAGLRPTGSGGLHPEAAAILKLRGAVAGLGGSDDNSNTQFAVIGTWVAQRRGVPAAAAISAIDVRFLRTQSPADHGWAYNSGNQSTPAMTCAGLLGLAVGKANDEARKAGRRLDGEANPKPKKKDDNDDPFYHPPARNERPKEEADPEEEDPEDEDQPAKKKPPTIRDMAIERGLKALGRVLAGGGGAGGNGVAWGGVDDLYFLWSLERVGVAYGLETIGDVDWYDWGCKKLLASQANNGSWGGSHGATVETSFALLFLRKANFVQDLTNNMKGKVKDPGSGELTGSRGGPAAIAAFGRKIDPNTEGPPDPKNPEAGKVRGLSEADRIAKDLVAKQSDSKWDGRLKAARENKGGQFTAGLAMAIPYLPDKRMVAAREALADRLTRMTPETLKKMLADRDPELRRAACLAIAMKDQKSLTFELIERVQDIDDVVVRAARAALKAMYNKDLGPPTGSNDDRKRIAFDEWKSWYTTEAPK